ncbi:hypothetical protein FNF29_03219 [Cafeteria roenbergensis]|uniref:EamA domain-containing protein n=1 Tax=Cafeteria roenbergensis TaxID=33653 RepID=A0A5A8D7A8_CAFRO|nr:hypothetical protein FNF29_03219 [Cafeteria roenbergensis]KAA0161115.1 hypothetical protein FNF31_03956 [Cafeteria roenbergensis]KAA0170870.1 hypothetical protein FNF28_01143 [Cafeteria roenbergensis]|eukprot:KAA0153402.1 hypothetical protein FNF29_03219 [Cafeteria roenbergensis]
MLGWLPWKELGLAAAILGVLVGASGEVLFVKSMRFWGVDLALFSAFLVQSYWPLVAVGAWGPMAARKAAADNRCYSIPWPRLRAYMVLGVVTTAANTLRLLALSMLPASIFVVASSSDIVFNILFSRLFLKKRFGAWHYTAAVLATVGMSIVAAGSKPSSACHAPPCHSSLLPGLACTVVAAALVAANAVLAECVLKDQKVPGMFGALELAMFYSIVPSVLTPILVMATGEWKQWGPVLGNVGLHGSTAAFAMVCSGAVMSKLVSRTGRFVVIREKSAFFFAMLNSAVRLATAMAAYVVLGEAFSWAKGAAVAIVGLALAAYLRGNFLAKQTAEPDSTELRGALLGESAAIQVVSQDWSPSTSSTSRPGSGRGGGSADEVELVPYDILAAVMPARGNE